MKIRLERLHLFTNDNEETIISFSSKLTFIYGNMGVGKSTLLNLVFYCMGGKIIYTPAIKQCLDSVQLDLCIGSDSYLLYRRVGATYIVVENIQQQKKISVSDKNFSGFIHECCGLTVRNIVLGSYEDKEVTLTFKNYNWFSYLNQIEMDSNFFNLNNSSFKRTPARNVLLTFFNNGMMTDIERKSQYRSLKKRSRQYEEGKNVFKYINGIWNKHEENSRLDYSDETIISEEISKICEKEILYKGDAQKLIELQEKMTYLKIRRQYEIRKRAFWMEGQRVKEEFSHIEDEIINNFSRKNEKVQEMYMLFLDCLRNIDFPGITELDAVRIDRRSFMPIVYNQFTGKEVCFDNLGSGGKRSLFKICFALAMHRFHAKEGYDNYLPSFFILDTPMKNISEREDKILYDKFYQYVLKLFSTELSEVQLIIVEKELRDLSSYAYKEVAIIKHMTNNDLLNPPLFKNYKGY